MKTLVLGTSISNGDLPDATVVMDKLQRVADLINITKLDIDNINGPSPALLALTNGSSVPTWQALSGDASISSAGALRVALQHPFALGGVLDPITTTYQTVASFAVPADGYYIVHGFVVIHVENSALNSGNPTFTGSIFKNATPQGAAADWAVPLAAKNTVVGGNPLPPWNPGPVIFKNTLNIFNAASYASATDTLSMQVKVDVGGLAAGVLKALSGGIFGLRVA